MSWWKRKPDCYHCWHTELRSREDCTHSTDVFTWKEDRCCKCGAWYYDVMKKGKAV